MKVAFLPSAEEGLRWFSKYYRTAFPEGRQNARKHMARAVDALRRHPEIGHPLSGTDWREYSVPRTPFSLIYQVTEEKIEILRLWDGRANPERLTAGQNEINQA